MIAITTSSSTSVKPRRQVLARPRDGALHLHTSVGGVSDADFAPHPTHLEGQVRANKRSMYMGGVPAIRATGEKRKERCREKNECRRPIAVPRTGRLSPPTTARSIFQNPKS
jgi:hypothetical protein